MSVSEQIIIHGLLKQKYFNTVKLFNHIKYEVNKFWFSRRKYYGIVKCKQIIEPLNLYIKPLYTLENGEPLKVLFKIEILRQKLIFFRSIDNSVYVRNIDNFNSKFTSKHLLKRYTSKTISYRTMVRLFIRNIIEFRERGIVEL
jgi:hypothetical protein